MADSKPERRSELGEKPECQDPNKNVKAFNIIFL
jgi:hypothetical protein